LFCIKLILTTSRKANVLCGFSHIIGNSLQVSDFFSRELLILCEHIQVSEFFFGTLIGYDVAYLFEHTLAGDEGFVIHEETIALPSKDLGLHLLL